MTYPTPADISRLRNGQSIIAVDPGDKTGVVILGTGITSTFHYEEFLSNFATIQGFCNLARPIFVVEQFITRPGSFAREQIAGKVCGACDLYCRQNGLTIVYQSPSNVKSMLPDNKALKAAGWSWSTPHERDALKHALYFLLTRK